MKSDDDRRRSNCPIDYALEHFGDKWSLLVIRDMLILGKRHYRDLLASEEGIATNILSDRLKKLEATGLITRKRDPENRRQVIYELTDKGIDLTPILMAIGRWSAKYDPDTAVPDDIRDRIKEDLDGFAEEIMDKRRAERSQS